MAPSQASILHNAKIHSMSIVPNSIFTASGNITTGTLNSITINSKHVNYPVPSPIHIMRIMADDYAEWNGTVYWNYEAMSDSYEVSFFYKHKEYVVYNDDDDLYEDYCFSKGLNVASQEFNNKAIVDSAIRAGEEDIQNMLYDTHPDGLWAVKK